MENKTLQEILEEDRSKIKNIRQVHVGFKQICDVFHILLKVNKIL